jgi:hypothetical protein
MREGCDCATLCVRDSLVPVPANNLIENQWDMVFAHRALDISCNIRYIIIRCYAKEADMKKTTLPKKPLSERFGESFVKVAFAEAGELYPRKPLKKPLRKGRVKAPVCANGETSSGLCA